MASLSRCLDDHDVLQTELLVDDKTLLHIIIDAVHCYVQAVNVEQKVGLHNPIYNNGVVVRVDIHSKTVHSYMQLNTLQEFS